MRSLSDLYDKEPDPEKQVAEGNPVPDGNKQPVGNEIGDLPPGAPPEVGKLLSGDSGARQADRDSISGLNGPPKNVPFQLDDEVRNDFRNQILKAAFSLKALSPIPNADQVEYHPGGDPKNVRDRIAQGPYQYRSMEEKARKEGIPGPVTKPTPNLGPLLPQPDMNKPGRAPAHESIAYRPGSNAPLGKPQINTVIPKPYVPARDTDVSREIKEPPTNV